MHASLWTATAPPAPDTPPLEGDHDVDVLVVGAGYAGLSTALHLPAATRVMVLESHEIGFGGSGRNNGLVIPTLSKPDPDQIVAALGPEKGPATVGLVRDSANHLFELIRTHGMKGAGEQTGWLQPAHSPDRMKLAESRVRQWSAHGADVDLVSSEEMRELLGSSHWHGGWRARSGGTVHPMAYSRELARTALARGATLHTHSRVLALHPEGSRWRAATANGSVVADRVVLATNAYTDDLWPGLKRTIVPIRSYQMATAPLSPELREQVVPGRQAVSDTRGDLRFFRWTDDHRIVTGAGMAWPRPRMSRVEAHVSERFQRCFPQAGHVRFEYSWWGYVGMTLDFLPHLYEVAPGIIAWIGGNGRGVALATSIGRELARFVSGTPARELPLPVTPPAAIPMHSLVRELAQFRVLEARLRDRRRM